MNDSSWERLVDAIDVNLGITGHQRSTEPVEEHPSLTQQLDSVEFTRDGEQYKLVRSTGPAIIDRKTHYSHRPGVANRVEYIYDEAETAHKVTLYRKAGEAWEPVELGALGL